ncbi:MAG: flippase-like domain-containing protein [Saprospiraceae bacterium]|nr:flippase-like domain-containing protein [Saprospiraceae bacterium]
MSRYYNFLKLIFLAVVLLLLYRQLSDDNAHQAVQMVWHKHLKGPNIFYLLICFILMPLNWLLESKKWQILMSPFVRLTSAHAIKTVLAGVAAGIVTPARIGEYGGRMITSAPELRPQVISATLLGSIAQNLCNILAGIIFSYYFLKSQFGVTYLHGYTFLVVVSLQVGLMIVMYYNLPKVANFIDALIKTKLTQKLSNKLRSLNLYNNRLLHKVLAISALRYVIYVLQYVLIIKFLGAAIAPDVLIGNITGIYLVQTILPIPAFFSVIARGELAILVWTSAGFDQVSALVATFGLWLINLIIPALIGLLIIYKTDIKKYFIKNEN